MRAVLVLAVASVGALATAPSQAATASSWPRRLYVVHPNDDFQNPVTDVAEAADGRLVFADKSGYLRSITPGGRLRTLARPVAGIAGIAPDSDGSILVVENARIIRVLPSGRRTVVAGTGQAGFSGDGGPAVSAEIHPADVQPLGFGSNESSGVVRTRDGSIVFTDGGNHRVRRIRPDGIIETIAGNGSHFMCDGSPLGDGGPAPAAVLSYPGDVVELRDGSLAVADQWNCRIRRITADGTIETIAGSGQFPWAMPSPPAPRPGERATSVPLYLPRGLAELPNGDIVFAGGYQVDRIARDGTWHPYLARSTSDFAGRGTDAAQNGVAGITVTHEGGVLVAWGSVYYVAPPHTSRTLVRIRDARAGGRHLTAYVDVTRPARATLTVRSGRRVIARSTRSIKAGRARVGLIRRFESRPYDVAVKVRSRGGAVAEDALSLYLGGVLGMRYVRTLAGSYEDEVPLRGCRRISRRRIDCRYSGSNGPPEVHVFTLARSGAIRVDGYPRQA